MKIDRLVRSNRKTIALIIQKDGTFIVRAPHRLSIQRILDVVKGRQAWIETQQASIRQSWEAFHRHSFTTGEAFYYLGNIYPLEIVETASQALSLDGRFYLRRRDLPQARQVFETWYRQRASEIMTERVGWYAAQYGFSYQRIRLTSALTRWGSCNPKGGLNFTWRLVMAPLAVIDNVVVHELVHTRIRNHSYEFWKQVQNIFPDYKTCDSWLKQNGPRLNLD